MLNRASAFFIGALALMAITANSHAATMKWCTTWKSQYVDSGNGENWYTSTSALYRPAHYTVAQVRINSTQQLIWNGVLDAEGCTPPLPVLRNTQYKFRQATYARREISGQAARRIYVNPDSTPFGPYFIWLNSYYTTSRWLLPSGTHTFKPNWHNGKTNLMPIMGKIMRNYSSRNFPPGASYIHTDTAHCSGTYYTWNGDVCIREDDGGQDSTSWKFIVAHEMAHRQADATGGPLSGSYTAGDESSLPPLCKCDHVTMGGGNSLYKLHCWQSRENTATAAKEGYAQFWSAATFNNTGAGDEDDCGFTYYKQVLRQSPWGLRYTLQPPVAIDCDYHERHMERYCNPGDQDRGTEGDWQSFFWNLWRSGSYKYSMLEIDNLWNTAGSAQNWDDLVNTVRDTYGYGTGKHRQFLNKGADAGVDHFYR